MFQSVAVLIIFGKIVERVCGRHCFPESFLALQNLLNTFSWNIFKISREVILENKPNIDASEKLAKPNLGKALAVKSK